MITDKSGSDPDSQRLGSDPDLLRNASNSALVSALGGAAQLRYWLHPAATRTGRVLQHMSGMGTSCIATVTAFLVVNAQNLGLAAHSLWLWGMPGLLGGIALGFASKRWQRAPMVEHRTSPQSRAVPQGEASSQG